MIDLSKFDRYQRQRFDASNFAQLFDEAEDTGQPGIRYHRFLEIWLEAKGTTKLSVTDTYPEGSKRLWRE